MLLSLLLAFAIWLRVCLPPLRLFFVFWQLVALHLAGWLLILAACFCRFVQVLLSFVVCVLSMLFGCVPCVVLGVELSINLCLLFSVCPVVSGVICLCRLFALGSRPFLSLLRLSALPSCRSPLTSLSLFAQ